MFTRFLAALLTLVVLACPASAEFLSNPLQLGTVSGTAAPGDALYALKGAAGPSQNRVLTGVPLLWARAMNNGLSALTDAGGTSNLGFTAPYAMHDIRALYALYQMPYGAGEAALPNPVTWSATLEYPSGTFTSLTFGGAAAITGRSGFVQSDPLGIDLPSQAAPMARTYAQVCLPPTGATAAAAGSGGTLAAATYYAKVTSICGAQGESGPSAEASVAVVANGTLTISWTPAVSWAPPAAPITTGPASVPQTAVGIYLSTSTGAERLVVILPVGPTNSVTITAPPTYGAASPPANQQYPLGPQAFGFRVGSESEGANYAGSSGNGSNQTMVAGAAWEASSNVYTFGPIELTGTPDQGLDVPVGVVAGDSIFSAAGDLSMPDRGPAARALIAANIPYHFIPAAGTTTGSLIGTLATMRMQLAGAGSFALSDMGTNDIFGAGATLATLQANSIAVWSRFAKRGNKVFQTTIIPRVTTTDNLVSATNETPGLGNAAQETVRVQFDTWLRGGAPLASTSNLTPVAVGTAGALLYGQAGHPLTKVFDTCVGIEVNAGNTLTQNGGRLLTNGTAWAYSIDGTHPTTLAGALMAAQIDTTQFIAP